MPKLAVLRSCNGLEARPYIPGEHGEQKEEFLLLSKGLTCLCRNCCFSQINKDNNSVMIYYSIMKMTKAVSQAKTKTDTVMYI